MIESREDAVLYSQCTSISGTLTIHLDPAGGLSAPAVVMPLLEEVGGSIDLRGGQVLVVPSLRRVQGNLSLGISHPVAMVFPELEFVGGTLQLPFSVFSDPVGRVAAPKLRAVGGSVRHTNLLQTVEFNALTSIGGSFVVGGEKCQAWELAGLAGFTGLEHIGGSLIITGATGLRSLKGLENLKSIGRDLDLRANYNLVDIEALSGVSEIPGSVTLGAFAAPYIYNCALPVSDYGNERPFPSLRGLHRLRRVGGYFLIEDAATTSLDELEALEEVGGNLHIKATPMVTLSTPPTLRSVGGLRIRGNDHLQRVDWSLSHIEGSVVVSGRRLQQVVMPELVRVGGTLEVDLDNRPSFEVGDPPLLVDFPRLAEIDTLRLRSIGDACLRASLFPALSSARYLDLGDVQAIGALRAFAQLESASTLALQVGQLSTIDLGGHVQRLETLTIRGFVGYSSSDGPPIQRISGLEALRELDALYLTDLPALDPCWVEDLVQQSGVDASAVHFDGAVPTLCRDATSSP